MWASSAADLFDLFAEMNLQRHYKTIREYRLWVVNRRGKNMQ